MSVSLFFVILFLYTIRDIIMYDARVPKFEIDSKLPVVKSCTCPSELPGIELKGSVVPINGAA